MHTTYHFKSADEIGMDTIDTIKNVYKNKAVVITVDEEPNFLNIESQKEFVRDSIKKYTINPDLLIDDEEAWKMINAEK